jgi:adenosylcobinamide kinase/adenosylcobinamide-phosphate guanylyltransferase
MSAPVNGLTLLIGGARSGKSDLAVEMGERHAGPVTFIATAQAFDDDMGRRISRHRADRPSWPTTESPIDLDDAILSAPADHLVIIDCLTLWVSNLLLAGWSDDLVDHHARTTSATAAERATPTVVVTNEVGLGIHPDTELGRRYRDLLGRVNRIWATAAERTLFLVAGRALSLHDPWELLA